MPTVTLTPSTYYLSNSNYLSVSNASNMYADCDSTTYATVTNSRTSTTSYYCYVRGFDLSSIPSDAIVSSFAVRIKARHSGGYAQAMYLYDGTSTSLGSSSTTLSTTATTHTINVTHDWANLVAAGSDLGIRINCRRSSRNTTAYVYVYGAEIEVTYTLPVYHSVTLTNSTSATVAVSDANPLEGSDVTVTASTITGIKVTDNGVDVTSQFVQGATDSTSEVAGGFTTGFSDSGANFYQSSSTTGTSWLEYAIGYTAESPYSTTNTSNTYVKPEGDTGWINYTFDFSSIPAGATVTDVDVRVYGARENSTVDSTHVARFQCYSGSTAKGTIQNFTSTSNSLVTVSDPGTWTRSELQSAQLRFEVGYYGGRMLGITWEVSYELDGYAYTISNIVADHAIVVTASGGGPTLYVKQGSAWVNVARAYKKVNGSWQQTSLDQIFQSNVNYKQG